MQKDDNNNTIGQPLAKIKIASIPNGILLTRQPNYNKNTKDYFILAKMPKRRIT